MLTGPVDGWDVVISVGLVGAAIAVSLWQRAGIERSIVLASVRAAVQLLAIGWLLSIIVESDGDQVWGWLWVTVMVVIAAEVVRRRSGIARLRWVALLAVGASAGVALGVVFGLGILEPTAINIIVIAGIVIGNALPSAVLAADRSRTYMIENHARVEGLLALGFDRTGARRFMTPEVTRTAMIPQIERTRVVGLIAIPGAMTGLLLAGVDPLDAVLAQIVIMYLILGAVAISVLVVTTAVLQAAFTPDVRLRPIEEL